MANPRVLIVELPTMLGPEARAVWSLAEVSVAGASPVEHGAVSFGAIGSLARYKPTSWVGVLPASVSTVMGCDLPASLAKQNKLQAALEGALEDKLLGEMNASALSCAPEGIHTLGRITQAAATRRDWLDKLLAQSKAQQVVWNSLVPETALLNPGEVYAKAQDSTVLLCSAEGDAASMPALAPLIGKDDDWTPLDTEPAQWLANAALSRWNVLQGDYGPKARSAQLGMALGELWRRGLLRPALWGLGALLLASVVGINAKAWQLRQQVADRKAQQVALLKKVAPNLPVSAEVPLLMNRELRTLRASTGQPNAKDVEAMLSAVNSTIAGSENWQRIEAKPGELTVGLARAPDAGAIEALKSRGYTANAEAAGLKLQAN